MITCGLKLTHDGALALLDGDRLVFSVEMEKLANGRRYSPVADLRIVPEVLSSFGYAVEDVAEWVIDGWDGDRPGTVSLLDHDVPVDVMVGPYRESTACPDILQPAVTGRFTIGGRAHPYTSYSHAAGHVAAAYCSSPFAQRREPAFVLIWDGGMFPRLYWVDPDTGVHNEGELFPLIGHAYATAGHHFGPFTRNIQSPTVDDLTVAGKLMAYIALGKVQDWVVEVLRDTFHRHFEGDSERAVNYRRTVGGFGSLFERSLPPVHDFFDEVRERTEHAGVSDEDILASVHQFLGDLLAERVAARMTAARGAGPWNLCFAGGCALNIKWNSALRDLPAVRQMWVPPFPNDSGSAIGVAALGMMRRNGVQPVSWHSRLGPDLVATPSLPDGWTARTCDPAELAGLLHRTGEPVVVLQGRAELGPRALGGRSILATATSPSMKDELNRVKGREFYRPVAPICLEDEAPDVFDPGTPDPYMLFDHVVRPEWVRRVPAVIHLDGTARLQTVSATDDPTLHAVLSEYRRLSGIPVLCNTSANANGCGFFPDVASAIAWGRVDRVWSDNVLFSRTHEDG